MIEELKVIAEIFKNATDGALYAYLAFIGYQLAKTSLIVFPILNGVKFLADKIFVDERKNENKTD